MLMLNSSLFLSRSFVDIIHILWQLISIPDFYKQSGPSLASYISNDFIRITFSLFCILMVRTSLFFSAQKKTSVFFCAVLMVLMALFTHINDYKLYIEQKTNACILCKLLCNSISHHFQNPCFLSVHGNCKKFL